MIFLGILPLAFLMGALAGILCYFVLKDHKKTAVIRGGFVTYLVLLFNRVWFSRFGKGIEGISLMPFSTLDGNLHFMRFVLNVIMFVPFGMFWPLLFVKTNIKIRQTAAAGLIMSLIIEAVQGIFGLGHVQTDDVIANVCGALIGYALADQLKS